MGCCGTKVAVSEDAKAPGYVKPARLKQSNQSAAFLAAKRAGQLDELCTYADVNNDGLLDAAECNRVVQAASNNPYNQALVTEYRSFLEAVDSNNDGKIQMTEFRNYFKTKVQPEEIADLACQLRLMYSEAQPADSATEPATAEPAAAPVTVEPAAAGIGSDDPAVEDLEDPNPNS